jgi:ubiquinone/menaquinone biosynthesis C-methylase UbiE
VLVLGTGNSLLSEKMHKGLALSRSVIGIDFEESIVKKMNNRGTAGVEYLHMDALAMSFDSNAFEYGVDKGTLDALCADRTPETATKVVNYLNEVVRVLNTKAGTYVCVSLL